ncbi:hypothetical protein K474DRAFT_1669604 [Panus rudis PR-1116 ss-1]|nr:hypothetical protein K474DRAFT_1669604 [Panus rudis PR-1116 ss-1]
MRITYENGMLAGRTLCAELTEVQQAAGKKSAQKDDKILTVVHLKLFDVVNLEGIGRVKQELTEYDSATAGMICHAYLFRVPEGDMPLDHPEWFIHPRQGDTSIESHRAARGYTDVSMSANVMPPCCSAQQGSCNDEYTRYLSGTRVASELPVVLDGRSVVEFAFQDLSVKRDGRFRLGYRVFNIFSTIGNSETAAILVGCLGGAFTVHSTEDQTSPRTSNKLARAEEMGEQLRPRL